MRCHLLIEDAIRYWEKGGPVRDLAEHQYDVLMFDPDEQTYCCEITPSRCLDPIYGTWVPKDGAEPTEEQRDELEDAINASTTQDCQYRHCSTVDALPHFIDGRLPSELPGTFVIEYDDDPDVEDLEDFRDAIQGNPPI